MKVLNWLVLVLASSILAVAAEPQQASPSEEFWSFQRPQQHSPAEVSRPE